MSIAEKRVSVWAVMTVAWGTCLCTVIAAVSGHPIQAPYSYALAGVCGVCFLIRLAQR